MRPILVSLVCAFLVLGCGKHTGSDDPGVKPPSGKNDPSVLNSVAGRYPILEMNGDAQVTGFLTVQAEAGGAGFTVDALDMASHPAKPMSLFSTKEVATWSQDGNRITQSQGNGDTATKVT